MGTRNRERRAAKARQRARDRARRGEGGSEDGWAGGAGGGGWGEPPSGGERVRMLLHAAVDARLGGDAGGTGARVVAALGAEPRQAVLAGGAGELRRALPRLWDGGWQPAELVREGRRATARAGRLLVAAVLADHAGRHRSTLDPRWAAQVDDLAAGDPAAQAAASSPSWLGAFADRESLAGADLAGALVEALAACLGAAPLAVLVPPPGQAGAAAGPASPPAGAALDGAVLAKVRALLAQAESTTYEGEAAAFTAKAQELMARHAIDAAAVWDEAGREERPDAVRLPVDDPYADRKSWLLQVVADHSRCRAVYDSRHALSTVVGFAADLAACEVLFTSLLVQAQVAMQAEAAAAGPGSRVRSRGFRSSFLFAYAHRIGERLAEVNRAVEAEAEAEAEAAPGGAALLPVLAARTGAVDDAVEERFGRLRSVAVRGGADGVGWALGRAAADRAQLTSGDLRAAPPTHPP